MSQSSPSVLIIRLDAIGDALALTPLLEALARGCIPTDLVLRAANRETFARRAVRAIFEAPFALRDDSAENQAAIRRFGAELATRDYSHVLVPTEDIGGYRLASAVGAPNRIGFSNGWGKPFKTLWIRSLMTRTLHRTAGLDRQAPHESAVLFELGRSLLGAEPPSRDPAQLRPFVIDDDPPSDPRVVLQITDKWSRLGIALDDVVELVRRLGAETAPLRVIASAPERAHADRVSDRAQVPIERFESVTAWKSAIASARVLVAPDSGAIHVAGMTGTPAVAIFPPSANFDLQVARWSPWAAPFRIVKSDRGWVERAAAALRALAHA